MHPDGRDRADIELVATRPRPRRRRFGLLAVNLSVIAAALVGIYVLGARRRAATPSRPTRSVPPSSTVEPTIEELLTIMPASPIDGKQSQKLPVAVRPRIDLADGQVVTVLAKGFLPGERVGVVMCVAEAALEGVDACDLGPRRHVRPRRLHGRLAGGLRAARRRRAPGDRHAVRRPGRLPRPARSGASSRSAPSATTTVLAVPPSGSPASRRSRSRSLTVGGPGPYAPDQVVDVAAAGLMWPREAQIQLCRAEQCIALVPRARRARRDAGLTGAVAVVLRARRWHRRHVRRRLRAARRLPRPARLERGAHAGGAARRAHRGRPGYAARCRRPPPRRTVPPWRP